MIVGTIVVVAQLCPLSPGAGGEGRGEGRDSCGRGRREGDLAYGVPAPGEVG